MKNDVQVSDRVYEFDLILTHTGDYLTPTYFELSSIQFGILYNANILNGGTLAVSIVPGSQTDIPAGQQQSQANMLLVGPTSTTGTRTIKITSKVTSAGSGAIVKLPIDGGTRVMRVRMTNTVAWAVVKPNLTFSFSTSGPSWITMVNAYIGTLSTNISVNGTWVNSALTNPTFNDVTNVYAVSGGGSYCTGGAAVTVGLAGSQIGKNYQLLKDGIAYGAALPGTGSALSWNVTDIGTYTCVTGTTAMTGNAIVTAATPLVASVSIQADFLSVCQGSAINLTATPTNGGVTPAYNWYFGGILQPTHLSTISYSGPASSFDVHAEMTSNAGCVAPNPSTSNVLSLVVNANPAAPVSGGNVVACTNALPATLVDNVPAGIDVRWYDAVTGGNLLASTPNYITSIAGTYYNEAVNPITGCISLTRTAVSLTVNANPAPPTSGGDVTVCANQLPATLVDIVPPLMSVNWYDAAQGGNLLVASSLTYSTSIAGTYYNETVNPATGCISTSRTAVVLTVNANPAAPVSGGDVTVCANALPATLVDIVPQGMEVKWYDAAIGGNFLANGANYITVTPGTYYNETVNPITTCVSLTRTAVILTVNANPAPPVSGGDVVVCANALPATLVDVVPFGMEVKWYDAATGGSFLANGANYITSTAGTYYNATVNPVTSCVSLTRTAVTLTINANPAAPVSGGDVVVCANALPATLVDIVPQGIEVKWYDAAIAGTFLFGGANYVTSTAGTYYNEAYNPTTGCSSLTRTAVSLTVNANPAAPVSGGDVAVCTSQLPATLVDIVPQGIEVKWYDAATAGTFLFGGANYVTSTAGTYYNEAYNPTTGCSSLTRTAVTLTITPTYAPVISIAASANPVIDGTSVTFTSSIEVGYTGMVYNWYVNGMNVSNSPTLTYAPANNDHIYVTISFNEACTMLATSNTVTMTVNPSVTSAPTVVTSAVSNNIFTGVTLNGNVTNNGGALNCERGFIWSTNSNPTEINGTKVTASTFGAGVYNVAITGLTPNTYYWYKAYATNAMGTTYGAVVQFDTRNLTYFTGVGNWSTAARWSNGIPNATSSAFIYGTCTVDVNGTAYMLGVQPSASITINTGINLVVVQQTIVYSQSTGTGAIVQHGNFTGGPQCWFQRFTT
ncbi:MAG: immunoglobulin domain-containing protein, partial [Ferruginibacter sp.]